MEMLLNCVLVVAYDISCLIVAQETVERRIFMILLL